MNIKKGCLLFQDNLFINRISLTNSDSKIHVKKSQFQTANINIQDFDIHPFQLQSYPDHLTDLLELALNNDDFQ